MKKLLLLGALALPASSLVACHRDLDERLGLAAESGRHEFDAASLAKDTGLERAVSQPSRYVREKLGSYRLEQHASLTLSAGEASDRLDESWLLELDGRGNSHERHDNSHDYGFERYAVDGSVYVRPRYGTLVRRAPEGDEIERSRDEQQGVTASWLEALGRFAERRDEGAVRVQGREARRVRLSLAARPAALEQAPGGDAARTWRQTMKVSRLAGVIDVDAATGAPLHVELDADYVAERGDGDQRLPPVSVRLAFRGDLDEVGAVSTIAAPEDSEPAPARPRPLVERDQLLDGLAAPVTHR